MSTKPLLANYLETHSSQDTRGAPMAQKHAATVHNSSALRNAEEDRMTQGQLRPQKVNEVNEKRM